MDDCLSYLVQNIEYEGVIRKIFQSKELRFSHVLRAGSGRAIGRTVIPNFLYGILQSGL